MSIVKQFVPSAARAWLRRQRKAGERKLLRVDGVTDWSVLRRLQPYRKEFGRRRGQCVDRYYIEAFLAAHQEEIQGRVAEVGGADYTARFGGGRVVQSDVIDLNEANTKRTMTVDLARTQDAPEGLFDCIIATQVLPFIHDYESAIRSLHKMLKPGGVLLVTAPGISPLVTGPMVAGAGEDWWRFTGRSAGHAFSTVFGERHVKAQTYGNVLTATAFLQGLVVEELTPEELDYHDPAFEVIIGLRADRRTQS